MIADYTELGILIGVIYGFIELIKYLIKVLVPKNGKDGNQDVCIARVDERLKAIETNHLPHIQSKLETIEKSINKIEINLAEISIRISEVIK